MSNAKEVPADRWFAMTRLDENRAKAQLALKSRLHWRDVTQLTIWGNHSSALYPDYFKARIAGKPVIDVISDSGWLETEFIKDCSETGCCNHSSARAFLCQIRCACRFGDGALDHRAYARRRDIRGEAADR